ncbi:MAG TPA: GNAT family protein [Kineosporiaceae bacterium]|nr:GNAT family protein [Kineosporiaceae bacterium]
MLTGVKMLQGQLVCLRARLTADVPVLHAQLHDDVASHVLTMAAPWRPISPDLENGPFSIQQTDADLAQFSVVEVATGELAGSASLWRIDTHNRNAHIGISLLPTARGRGLGTDAVKVLCEYGFSILGLHRLQLETASDNVAMRKTARTVGFTEEGVQRQAYWTAGRFADDVLYGLLTDEWNRPG